MSGFRNGLIKRFVYVLLILGFILGVFYFLVGNQEAKAPEQVKDNAASTEELVKEVVSLSKKGKVIQVPFISGESDRGEVTSQWGEAKEKKTDTGDYMNFPNHHVTVGFLDDAIFDIRSFDSKIQGIRLNDIKKYSGEPDETKYYKDDSHNQAILIYHVNASYQLKWILPKSTDENSNPAVDHISVVSLAKKEASETSMTALLSKMSLNEKIGQMMLAGINGTKVNENTRRLINQYHVGGFIFFSNNLTDPDQTVQLLNQIKSENAANPLPLLLSVDQEGGRVTRLPGDLVNFPTNKEIGSINQSDFSYKVGTLLGKELNEFGFNLDFAPVLDINSNPNNPVIGDRSFGEDPDIVSNLGISTMKGIQSQHIIATIKHFPGHGDTSVDSHLELPVVNKGLDELESLELIPFEQAIKKGADVVMVAHILLPALDSTYPASLSEKVVTDILRKQLDFNGIIMTDDMTMEAITDNYQTGAAAVQAVKAGSDIVLVAHRYDQIVKAIEAVKTAVLNGEISEERIDESVERIMTLKKKYNIEDIKVKQANLENLNQMIHDLLNSHAN